MILFPNAKINLGLRVLGRRSDGYHDLSTVMVPVGWCDVLELVPAPQGQGTSLTVMDDNVDCPPEKSLVMKAFAAMETALGRELPPTAIYLKKLIPDQAGMGGGSADATFTLKGLNDLYELDLDDESLARIAAGIGADCPFFITNRPALCTGIGTVETTDITVNCAGMSLLIAKPLDASVSTAQAYAGMECCGYDVESPAQITARPVAEWRDRLINDFEPGVFRLCPSVAALKQQMYAAGAVYASMTGSGAAVYGLYESDILAHRAAGALAACVSKVLPMTLG